MAGRRFFVFGLLSSAGYFLLLSLMIIAFCSVRVDLFWMLRVFPNIYIISDYSLYRCWIGLILFSCKFIYFCSQELLHANLSCIAVL